MHFLPQPRRGICTFGLLCSDGRCQRKRDRHQIYEEWQEALRECGCKAVLAEVEAPDVIEDGEERRSSERRMEFYRRNGLRDTEIRTWLFSVKYRILSLDLDSPKPGDLLYKELIGIYRRIFPDFYFGKEVVLSNDANCDMIQPGIFLSCK